jgi:hypothetical protein
MSDAVRLYSQMSIELRYAVDGAGDEQNFLYLHRNFILLVPSRKTLPLRNCCIQSLNNTTHLYRILQMVLGSLQRTTVSQIPK